MTSRIFVRLPSDLYQLVNRESEGEIVEKNLLRVGNDIPERGEFQTRGPNGQEKTKIGFVKRAGDGNLRRLPDNRAASLPFPESIRRFCSYNCPYISRGERSFYRSIDLVFIALTKNARLLGNGFPPFPSSRHFRLRNSVLQNFEFR